MSHYTDGVVYWDGHTGTSGGHFRPKTLWSQDISSLVPKCPLNILAPLVPKCPRNICLGHFGTTYTLYTEVSH